MRVAKIVGLDAPEYIHEDGSVERRGHLYPDWRMTGAVVCPDAREQIANGTAPMQAMDIAGGVLRGAGLFAPEPSETYSLADVLAFTVQWKNADGTQRAWLTFRERGDTGERVKFDGDGYQVVPLDDRNEQQQSGN
jgi:hypothetical protein